MIDSGGEEAALAAMKKNIAVMYFAEVWFPAVRDIMPFLFLYLIIAYFCCCSILTATILGKKKRAAILPMRMLLDRMIRRQHSAEGQIQSAGEVLQRKLGKERQDKTGGREMLGTYPTDMGDTTMIRPNMTQSAEAKGITGLKFRKQKRQLINLNEGMGYVWVFVWHLMKFKLYI